jgi:hypothetical protein
MQQDRISPEQLKQKRKYIRKEPKTFSISHEAHLLFRAIAQERNLGIGDLMEVLAQEEAERRP